jgi:hypothetical protein
MAETANGSRAMQRWKTNGDWIQVSQTLDTCREGVESLDTLLGAAVSQKQSSSVFNKLPALGSIPFLAGAVHSFLTWKKTRPQAVAQDKDRTAQTRRRRPWALS